MPHLFFSFIKESSKIRSDLEDVLAYDSFCDGPFMRLSYVVQDGHPGFILKLRDSYTIMGDACADEEVLAIMTRILASRDIIPSLGEIKIDVSIAKAYQTGILCMLASRKNYADGTQISIAPNEIQFLYPDTGMRQLESIREHLLCALPPKKKLTTTEKTAPFIKTMDASPKADFSPFLNKLKTESKFSSGELVLG